jgi:cyclopropane fatty-acyl-phospholipid synthase-like methyltransferase
LEKVFQNAMSALSLKTYDALLKVYDFSKFKHILDVGGGVGTNAVSLVKNNPSLHATVFDMPSICGMAKANIHQLGFDDRVNVHAGNFLKDPFPEGADGIIFNHIMPIWSEEHNLDLLQKSYQALPKGGAVFIFNMMSSDDDTGPLTPAFGSLYFLTIATGEGMLYRWKDYISWLKQAGFQKIERIDHLPLHHGLLIGKKG